MRAATPRVRRLLRAEAALLAAATRVAATQVAATRASESQAAASQKLVQAAAGADVLAPPRRSITNKKPARAKLPAKTVPRETTTGTTRSSHQAVQQRAVPRQTFSKRPWTGKAIRALRARLSVSQETLAALIGRHVRCVSKWERERVAPDVVSSFALWALAEQPAHVVHATVRQLTTRREALLQAAVLNAGIVPSRGAHSRVSHDPAGGWNGKTVQALRARLGLSRRELARLLGMGYGTVADWEGKGRAVGPRSVLLLRAVRAMTPATVQEAVGQLSR